MLFRSIWIHINPRYTRKYSNLDDEVYCLKEYDISICNSVETIYDDTMIQHNNDTKDTFFNIGGIKTILPILSNVANHNVDSEFK